MWYRLVIDDNTVYEIDDECVSRKQGKKGNGGKCSPCPEVPGCRRGSRESLQGLPVLGRRVLPPLFQAVKKAAFR